MYCGGEPDPIWSDAACFARQGSARGSRRRDYTAEKHDLMIETRWWAGIVKCFLACTPPCRFVRDERSHHLHGDESDLGKRHRRLWLLLHPGVGGLPSGADQRTHLRYLEEARMSRHSHPGVPCYRISPVLKFKKKRFWCLSTNGPRRPTQLDHDKGGEAGERGGIPKINKQINTKQPILSQLKDVYSIYGLKRIYNTFYIYVHSCCVALSMDTRMSVVLAD